MRIMRLSRYSDNLVRVLMQAAVNAPQRITVDDVARTFGVSRHLLVKGVHELGRHGYLATRRGVGGGFTLGREPSQIRLGDIIRLGEATDAVIDCKDRGGQRCRLTPACRLKGVLDEAAEAFFSVLDAYTLEDLVKDPAVTQRILEIQTK